MTRKGRVGVGIIGAGMISDTYLENLKSFPDIEVHIVGDLDRDRATAKAAKWRVPEAGAAKDVLAHEAVEIVVNLTIPAAHAPVALDALDAGKHVWTEKPIAVEPVSAAEVLSRADELGLRVGVAPDTVLGPAIQTARRMIARGDIGIPLAAQSVMEYLGPDRFHPNPEFLFDHGGGPLLDMGPYYLTALVAVFGPIARVAAFGRGGAPSRTIRVGERAGTEFPVNVPTLVNAIVQYENEATSSSTFSFESHRVNSGFVEITGSEATMLLPNPVSFTGDVLITREGELFKETAWTTTEPAGVLTGRGLGLLDMARAIRSGRRHVATGELGYHILDTMAAASESITTGCVVDVHSTVAPIPLVPAKFDPYVMTLSAD